MCYIVLIWTLIILTLGNNIHSHSFNWHKPVDCILTDKINAYKAAFAFDEFWNLRIRWMQILTSFVTSLITTYVLSSPQVSACASRLSLFHAGPLFRCCFHGTSPQGTEPLVDLHKSVRHSLHNQQCRGFLGQDRQKMYSLHFTTPPHYFNTKYHEAATKKTSAVLL